MVVTRYKISMVTPVSSDCVSRDSISDFLVKTCGRHVGTSEWTAIPEM